jgi:hypothetical protein
MSENGDLAVKTVANDGNRELWTENFDRDVATLLVTSTEYGSHRTSTDLGVDLVLAG